MLCPTATPRFCAKLLDPTTAVPGALPRVRDALAVQGPLAVRRIAKVLRIEGIEDDRSPAVLPVGEPHTDDRLHAVDGGELGCERIVHRHLERAETDV